MYTDTYGKLISDLRNNVITHTEFLKEAGCQRQYLDWCREHCIKPDEKNAELFFDMHGFEETETVKEFVEPVTA